MQFTLIDRIVDLRPGEEIVAVKNLSLAEEYLADHFPGFPVMPGVLMLEAMTQASAWLIRATEDFAHSMVLLKQARNVRFASFVKPGQTLTLKVKLMGMADDECKVKAEGWVEDRSTLTARLVLNRYNLADQDPLRSAADQRLIQHLQEQMAVLHRPLVATEMASAVAEKVR
ncbi:Beta-hydroxyacyl-ACP dehydratase [Planctomycetales bacterium 10988]|nr:Beta-hydroxyacyl-ACP dehydratase [Planctomycetales bacterium 10988]